MSNYDDQRDRIEVRVKARNRRRKALQAEQDRRMRGDRRTQHITNAITKRADKLRRKD